MKRVFLFLATNLAIIIVASITLSLLGVGSYLDGTGLNLQALLIFCFVFGMAGSFISLLLSKKMAKWSMGVELIDQPENRSEEWLLQTVRRQAEQAGIGMPEVGIFPADQANAFATGWNRNDALVAVSKGMLQRFEHDEVEAVLGHEIGHVANGDMVTLALIQGVVNTFVMFLARVVGFVVDRVVLKNERGLGIGYFVTTILAEIVLAILASMIVFWFSRRREFRADEEGARLGSRNGMINALERLKTDAQQPTPMPDSMKAFGISGGKSQGWKKLFMTHPPLDERISALRNLAA
ncbi:protease HtpX [Balneolaceae bacterium YR4-1]|uniref:Protease HtpX homolog n=1 Tax=Halalkalibaculum roseum TaxID=2709311 RepID=A0A6M1SVJ2_9BACT|nr:protease HtpX [Halalkalibaculum roseum]NGP76118.1 protease HtpX [Halalkalibaculum roseum]